MFSTKQLDQISDTVDTMSMPEVFYGFNHLYVCRPDKDVLLEFSPVPALSLSSFAKQKEYVKGSATLQEQMEKLSLVEREDRALNMVEMSPKLIEVKEAALWKKKDMSKVKDFKQIEVISDWTYSTPYKGNVHTLSK